MSAIPVCTCACIHLFMWGALKVVYFQNHFVSKYRIRVDGMAS